MRKPEELKSFLGRDQLRLYKLIWERFVASQMASAIMDTVTARLINNNVQFRASGSVVKFPGFMKVYVESKDDGAEEKDKMLPPLEVGNCIFKGFRTKATFYTTSSALYRGSPSKNT